MKIIFIISPRMFISEIGFLCMFCFTVSAQQWRILAHFDATALLHAKTQFDQTLFLHHLYKRQQVWKANNIVVLLWKEFWPCRCSERIQGYTLRTMLQIKKYILPYIIAVVTCVKRHFRMIITGLKRFKSLARWMLEGSKNWGSITAMNFLSRKA